MNGGDELLTKVQNIVSDAGSNVQYIVCDVEVRYKILSPTLVVTYNILSTTSKQGTICCTLAQAYSLKTPPKAQLQNIQKGFNFGFGFRLNFLIFGGFKQQTNFMNRVVRKATNWSHFGPFMSSLSYSLTAVSMSKNSV